MSTKLYGVKVLDDNEAAVYITGPDGKIIGHTGIARFCKTADEANAVTQANADMAVRIAACLNACDGLPTEKVELLQYRDIDSWGKFASALDAIHTAAMRAIPLHPCQSVRVERQSRSAAGIAITIESLGHYLEEAQKQRDELLEALEEMLVQFSEACITPEDDNAVMKARAAIAKAKGDQS